MSDRRLHRPPGVIEGDHGGLPVTDAFIDQVAQAESTAYQQVDQHPEWWNQEQSPVPFPTSGDFQDQLNWAMIQQVLRWDPFNDPEAKSNRTALALLELVAGVQVKRWSENVRDGTRASAPWTPVSAEPGSSLVLDESHPPASMTAAQKALLSELASNPSLNQDGDPTRLKVGEWQLAAFTYLNTWPEWYHQPILELGQFFSAAAANPRA